MGARRHTEVPPVGRASARGGWTHVDSGYGRVSVRADVDVVLGEALFAALDPLCRPVPAPAGSPDPRGPRQRRADAFGQVITTYLARSERPSSGGILPHVFLVVPASVGGHTSARAACRDAAPGSGEGLGAGSPVASLGFGGPVSSATVASIVCDAAVGRIGVDRAGVPLDVGRERRLVTPGIRTALQIRDRGCAFPGCGRPVGWTDAHYCVPWAEGGATSVDNCVLLCRMHYTAVHHTGWEVFIGHDRHPWFREPADPARPGHERRVLRSHARRTLTLAPDSAAGGVPPIPKIDCVGSADQMGVRRQRGRASVTAGATARSGGLGRSAGQRQRR